MHPMLALTAPAALLLPLAAGVSLPVPAPETAGEEAASAPQSDAGQMGDTPLANPLDALRADQSADQIRIEQRVVIRITPAPPAARQNMLAELPQRAVPRRFEETRKEKCVPLDGIAGVQTGSGNRLVLFLRDRRMISVNLEKACRARDFYSGFYVEKSKDGRLCVDRDQLQSRTGVRCEVEAMRQLVEVSD
ncbi:MAG: hypothetical protein GC147_01850 [Porphyrobacter sp.]|nr:hypothetical protein [Porphyrobacter sp.]